VSLLSVREKASFESEIQSAMMNKNELLTVGIHSKEGDEIQEPYGPKLKVDLQLLPFSARR